MAENFLYYGDNLGILRRYIKPGSHVRRLLVLLPLSWTYSGELSHLSKSRGSLHSSVQQRRAGRLASRIVLTYNSSSNKFTSCTRPSPLTAKLLISLRPSGNDHSAFQ